MAPLVLVQQKTRSIYIDLTKSDDEDNQPQVPVHTQQPLTHPISTSPILPPPSQSATSRRIVSKTAGLTTRIIPNGHNKYDFSFTPGLSKKAPGPSRVPLRPSPSTPNSPAQKGRPIDHSPKNGENTDQGRSLNPGHAVKRRKVEGGMGHGPGAPRPSPYASQGSASQVKPEPKQESTTRGSARRTSSDYLSVEHGNEVRQALEKQVFPHILAAFSGHRGKLSSADRDCIGQKIAGDLVKPPVFMQNFLASNFKLSAKYEKQLALRAEILVNRYTKLVLEGLSIHDLMFLDSADAGYVPIERTADGRSSESPESSAASNSDAETSELEAVAVGQRHLHQPKLHDYFSSLATSPSTDNVGPKTPEDSKMTGFPSSSAVTIRTRRSTRNLRPQTRPTTPPPVPVTIGAQTALNGSRSKQSTRSHKATGASTEPACQRIEHPLDAADPKKIHSSHHRAGRSYLTTLLREREMTGIGALNFRHGQTSFRTEAMNNLEDSLVPKSHWTNCSGDIATISWAGEGAFVCGCIAHSDSYNMQYNKPGNLVFGSLPSDTLKAVADHRIIRPLIDPDQNKENASHAMRQTQDPWLYTSVVSASYSETNGLTFTASFDKTVKIWAVSEDGSSMALVGTWDHDDKVNFVVTSQVHNRVATAADVYNDAIRVYDPEKEDITNSPYHTYSGIKAQEQANEVRAQDTWAYFPATIQWGKSPSVSNLLLVGYSPRSVAGDDADIPEDKKNSGELCIWNAEDQSRIAIGAGSPGRTQNVFEVVWHPSQPCFLAATSPCGTIAPDKTRTQVQFFAQNECGVFISIRALDCPALDINELTIMPNSRLHCYVGASCTDGNTYVWDTAARSDEPIHILNHGESLDNPLPDIPREIGDAGVKFATWGQTCERLYTGSSDGRVNAWNVQAPPRKAFIRTVLEVSGGISAGVFSKDYSKLLIGDSTGKVHLLAFDDSDAEVETPLLDPPTIGLGARLSTLPVAIPQPPKLVVPHAEPPIPSSPDEKSNNISTDEESGPELAHKFLAEGQLILYPDPLVGAVQGPNYYETSLFRAEAHEEEDIKRPLKPSFRASQKFKKSSRAKPLDIPKLKLVKCSGIELHFNNLKLDGEFKAENIEFECDCLLIEELD
ncbi:uncharacterized protein BP5553_02588 [Venustampulla echinocandica]|uniref:WD40 repeat-like protein n=1 Tax=Venustampulla echinocandica TaxID=2656787 RepID=A0A370TRW9_9HELO|nr:uncharacterized protein BP5553_02588 [Venustampulla echinocandica]RDL38248.1 hypothetical protein BP5553_02588 [Venustampulla echinocandica]